MNICYQRRDVLTSKKSQRSLRRFSTLIDWFSTGIMCTTQIWATCTRDSAPKWIAKTHESHWVHVYSPCNKFQTLRILIFKFLYIQNLFEVHETYRVIIWTPIQSGIVLFCQIWDQFWCNLYLITNGRLLIIGNQYPKRIIYSNHEH